jgi:hypothetical protein
MVMHEAVIRFLVRDDYQGIRNAKAALSDALSEVFTEIERLKVELDAAKAA